MLMVASEQGTSVEILCSACRDRELVIIRKLLSLLLYRYAQMSKKAIGRLMGGRNHSTIINQLDDAMWLLDNNQVFQEAYLRLGHRVAAIISTPDHNPRRRVARRRPCRRASERLRIAHRDVWIKRD